MAIVLYSLLLTLTILTDGRPFDERSDEAAGQRVMNGHPPAADVVLLVKLVEHNRTRSSSTPRLVFLVQDLQDPRNPEPSTNGSSSSSVQEPRTDSDPNIVLLIQHFRPESNESWSQGSEGSLRLTREMSPDEVQRVKEEAWPARLTREMGSEESILQAQRVKDEGSRHNFLDLMMMPKRKWPVPPPMMLSPPPPMTDKDSMMAASGRNNPGGGGDPGAPLPSPVPVVVESSNEEDVDFLSSLSNIPNLWHDLGQILTQPLRIGSTKNPYGTERDSYEAFGMVAKAPYILCPLGYKKNSQGYCRPVFRTRRGDTGRLVRKVAKRRRLRRPTTTVIPLTLAAALEDYTTTPLYSD